MTVRIGLDATSASQSVTVTATEPTVLYADTDGMSLPFPLTVRAKPGGGGTLLVEYQLAESGDWTAWPAGTVAVATVYIITGPVLGLRVTAAVSTGTIELIH